jgi:hypothetical protein
MPDGWEVNHDLDPLKLDHTLDPDKDRLSNLYEYFYSTNPWLSDTDDDGLSDRDEVYVYLTSPREQDTDEDAIPDGWEVKHGLNPLLKDSLEDPDEDRLTNLQEYYRNNDPHSWDNWLILFGGYLIPFWGALYVAIKFSYPRIRRRIENLILARKKGYKTYKEMMFAEGLGFEFSSVYYYAIQLGFSTKDQFISALLGGYVSFEDWISAQIEGFEEITLRVEIERIGFTNFLEFLFTAKRELRKFRFRLNQIVSVYADNGFEPPMNPKKRKNLNRELRRNIKDLQILRINLEKYSSVSTKDYELNTVLKSELDRSIALIAIAKEILSKLGN